MLLPAVTRFSVDGAPTRYATIARCMDLADGLAPDGECCQILIEKLQELNRELEIPSPKSFGIDQTSYEKDIEKMTSDAAEATSTAYNPIAPNVEQIAIIYRAAYAD